MYPVLFTVGGLTIHAYGVMAVVAMMAASLHSVCPGRLASTLAQSWK